MKKFAIIIIALIVIITGVYLYIRFVFLHARDFKPDNSKATSLLDLRPALIAKLQQLVKDGSRGLYVLAIEKIDPDLVASKLDIINASIHPDTAILRQLDQLQKLPDDIFNIRFDSLHIDGLGIGDLLHKKEIDITSIFLNNPIIEIFHTKRLYNKKLRAEYDSLSLYQRLSQQMTRIGIGIIDIQHGTLIDHDIAEKDKIAKFDDLHIRMDDLLIDSSTQFDHKRFFFAKHATLGMKNYVALLPDSLFYFSVDSVFISGDEHKMILFNIGLKPRINRHQFESRLKTQQELYQVVIPKITLSDVNWWAMINRDEYKSSKAEIFGGDVSVYLDKSLPAGPPLKKNNFPQQLLMRVASPVSINNLNIHSLNFTYEEFNPDIGKSGIVSFNNINGRFVNLSNIPAEIKTRRYAEVTATCLFMNKVPMNGKFRFDMSKYRTGEFTADIHMGELDSSIVNPIAERLSLFTLKSGHMQEATTHIEGNNDRSRGSISMIYSDLRITLLKTERNDEGKQKKKRLASFIANKFLIKDSNPSHDNALRQLAVALERDNRRNFISFTWVSILSGILKTIGVPVSIIIK